ncbi:MAG: 50S ribosomal protein L31 [Anaerolineae bacterium]|nr:50S ribosomal protein L31 [Anaerolineae bacterium]
MRPKIHPKWYENAQVTCACGNTWTVGATVPEIRTDVCSKCHPFFTGEQRIVDTEGQVDRFMRRLKAREDALREVQERKDARTSPNLGIADLGLSQRVQNSLQEAGIVTVSDVLERMAESGDEGLTNIRGFGLKALADLKKLLRAQGFTLPGDAAEANAA